MRTIKWASQFKKDYKTVKKRPRHRDAVDELLEEVLRLLVADRPLPPRYFDHPLTGDWKDHRDCHLRPDLVLIYRKVGEDVLQLVRLGTHSDLSL